MTDADLTSIESRANAATPSPWTAVLGSGDHICTGIMHEAQSPDELNTLIADLAPDYFDREHLAGHSQLPTVFGGQLIDHRPNMDFIMAARDDVPRLVAEVRRLQATLDGDPYQTATPDQRRAWRLSAIRYADKVEVELNTSLAHLDAIIAAYQNNDGLGPMLIAIRSAKEWRGTVEQPAHQT